MQLYGHLMCIRPALPQCGNSVSLPSDSDMSVECIKVQPHTNLKDILFCANACRAVHLQIYMSFKLFEILADMMNGVIRKTRGLLGQKQPSGTLQHLDVVNVCA